MYVLVITAKFDGTVEGVYGFPTEADADDFLMNIYRTQGRELGLQYTVTEVQ